VPFLDRLGLDAPALLYATAVGLLCTLLFGMLPARRSAGIGIAGALRESGRGAVGSTLRLRSLLIVGEVALSVVLLVGAGLLVQSFAKLRGYDPGFADEEVLSLRSSVRGEEFASPAQRAAYFEEAADRLARLPGVVSVSAVNFGPPLTGFQSTPFDRPDRPADPGSEPIAVKRQILPRYFATLDIPVVGGRAIDRRDGERAPRVVVVNRQLARRFFAGEDPVGRFVLVRGESSPRQVIGVVGDERSAAPDPRPQPVLYVPHAQDAIPVMNLLVRTAGVPGAELAREAELALWSVSRSINVYQVETLAERLDDLHWRWRFAAQLLSAFAALALVLGAVGLYSVVSYAVRSRRREQTEGGAIGEG
jgi:putative ABC transport system permease protein